MTEFQNLDETNEMVRRFGADRVTQQAGLAQYLFALPMPSEEYVDPPPAKSRMTRPIPVVRARGVDRINVMNGAPGNLGVATSGGARFSASSVKKFTGRKDPLPLAQTLVFSIEEYEVMQGDQAVDAVLKVLDAGGANFGQYMARSFANPQVDEPATDVADTATSMDVAVMNGWWPGQTYEVVDDATGAIIGRLRPSDVVPNFDGGATISFDTDNGQLGFDIDVSAQSIYLLGQGDEDRRIGSIADATDSTVDLYDIDQERFPAGLRQSLAGAFSKVDGRRLCSMVFTASRRYPTHWITSPIGRDGIVNDQIDQVRFVAGQSDDAAMDPYADAMTPLFNGLPIIGEPVYDDDVIDLVHADHVMLRENWAFRPRSPDGSAASGSGRNVLVLDHDNLAANAYFDGGYSVVFDQRRCHARFTDVSTT